MTIRFEKLSKYYLESCALKDATGKFIAGEKVLVVGENGSGKSTFLKIISGQISATSGDVFLDGSKLKNNFRKRFSILGEAKFLYLDLTAKENFELFLTTHEERVAAERLCQDLQLNTSNKSTVRELSSGQRQKVSIVRAIAKNAEILVLDEPLNFLDSESKNTVAKLISDTEQTVVLVSHEASYFPGFKEVVIKKGVLTC